MEQHGGPDPDAIAEIVIPTPTGERLPLSLLSHIALTQGPTVVHRDCGKRRVIVTPYSRGAATFPCSRPRPKPMSGNLPLK